MKNLITLLIVTSSLTVQAQHFYNSLYGFKLGQYREAAKTELGKPFKSGKYDDGYEYEGFLLKSDKSLYIIFEYAPADTSVIWSIQVSGTNLTTDIGLQDLKLGINKTDAEKLIGKPSSIKNIGEYGEMWSYNKTNLSVEVNKHGKLSSVKILDNSHDLFPKGPDVKKIPSFDIIQKTLSSNDNAEILKLLAGDIEVYYKGNTYYFKKSFSTEQSADYSEVLSIIKILSKDLATVNTKNQDEYEENMRIALGEDIKHVIKIKKGHLIKEIVLKYFGGQYYIFEINANG
ncbi:MAG TPA: hypothetical protein VK671_06625 [Mucilaginibacter sp.]|jgi:hypothetical protein|nr:hypothetical protein [Mucilaginibacter sp.]